MTEADRSPPPADVEREVARLASDPQHVLLEGLHSVKHAIRFGAEIVLLVTADRAATLALADALAPDVVDRLSRDLVPVEAATLARLTGTGRPVGGGGAGVLGVARRPAPGGVEIGTRRFAPVVVLDNPRNPGNVGAAVRVAAGFGASAVLSTGSVDPWHPTVLRASAGLHFATVVARVSSEHRALSGDWPLIAFDSAGEDLRGVQIPDDAVLAFGSERHGLSAAVRSRAHRVVAIPMRELVSSYNLAASVAVGLYHWSAGSRPDGVG